MGLFEIATRAKSKARIAPLSTLLTDLQVIGTRLP